QPALPAADALGHLQHPAGPLAAGRTLAARLMLEEPANVVENVHDAGLFVENRHRRRAQAEPADLAGAVEVERCVKFGLGHQAHADAAGDAALRLPTLPNTVAVLRDQLAHGDAQRQLDTARFIDVAADAVELRAKAAGVARVLRVRRHAH